MLQCFWLVGCFLSLSCVLGMNSSLCCPFCKASTLLIDRYLLSKIQCFDLNFLISVINIQENFILKTIKLRDCNIYIYINTYTHTHIKSKAFSHHCYSHHFCNHNWCQKGNGRFIQILFMSWLHWVNLDYEGLLLSGIPGCDLVRVSLSFLGWHLVSEHMLFCLSTEKPILLMDMLGRSSNLGSCSRT